MEFLLPKSLLVFSINSGREIAVFSDRILSIFRLKSGLFIDFCRPVRGHEGSQCVPTSNGIDIFLVYLI